MLKKVKQAVYLFCALIFFWQAHPAIVQTVPLQPIITEVYPAPIGSASEWVELSNPSGLAIDLTGWTLEDQLSTPSLITTLSQTIQPFQVLVIPLPTAKLNNSADGVTLKNASGTLIDSMSYTSSASDQSWTRSSLTSPATWSLTPATPGQVSFPSPSPIPPSPTPSPTPSVSQPPTPAATPPSSPSPPPTPSVVATPSPTPAPTPDSGVILTISEISACPETGQSEWVEVYNPGSTSVQLQNFLVRDASGNTELLNGTTPPTGYAVFFWSKSLLNNTGDSLFLISNTGQILDSATYSDCQPGHSLTLMGGVWSASTPTPGKANQSSASSLGESTPANEPAPSPYPSPSPSDLTSIPLPAKTQPSLPRATLLSNVPWWPTVDISHLQQPEGTTAGIRPTTTQLAVPPPSQAPSISSPTTLPTMSPLNAIIGGCLLLVSSGSILTPAVKQLMHYVQTAPPATYASIPSGSSIY